MRFRPTAVNYVSDRYDLLVDLLEDWGYEIVTQGRHSGWHERGVLDPLLGLVYILGRREWEGLQTSFAVREFWAPGLVPGREQIRGNSLVRYHYHGQVRAFELRYCLDPERHPENESHVHRPESPDRREACPLITALGAVQSFDNWIADALDRGILEFRKTGC